MGSRPQLFVWKSLIIIAWLGVSAGLIGMSSAWAETGTDFAGTVLTVDPAAGKLGVKKEGGGTRFTFVVNDKTQFSGPGLTSLKDVKKGDSVTVAYVVTGSQYVVQKLTKSKELLADGSEWKLTQKPNSADCSATRWSILSRPQSTMRRLRNWG